MLLLPGATDARLPGTSTLDELVLAQVYAAGVLNGGGTALDELEATGLYTKLTDEYTAGAPALDVAAPMPAAFVGLARITTGAQFACPATVPETNFAMTCALSANPAGDWKICAVSPAKSALVQFTAPLTMLKLVLIEPTACAIARG